MASRYDRDDFPKATPTRTVPQDNSGSGLGVAILLIVVGLLFVVGPFFIPKIPTVSKSLISGFGVLLLLVGGIMFTITQLYEKASMNEAFVRTGVGGPKVVVDGAALFIPAIHKLTRVSLETIRLEINREGTNSFITGDSLRVDVKAQFYIKVNRDAEAIKAAATSLGNKSGIDEMIMELVGDKLVSGLRTVAGRKALEELHSHVDKYSEEVKEIVEKDLEHNGLLLESVTITSLNQTPPSNLRPDENIFDAQGAKKIAEVTQAQRVLISKLKAEADQTVKQQEVSRDKQVFVLEADRASADADRDVAVKNASAEATRKAAEFAAEQTRLSGLAQVTATKAVEIAEVEKAQAVQTASAHQEEAVQTAQIQKDKAVEIANREKQISVAEAEKRRAAAETQRLTAETEREKANQDLLTVTKEKEAERLKKVAVIAKESDAQQTQIERNMEADVAAYTTVKNSEAEKTAAENTGAAKITLATATKQAAELEAAGQEVVQLVPVKVAAEQVKVDQSKVAVLQSELEAKTKNEKMAFDLQVELAKVAAAKDVGMAFATAIGQALAAADMTIYGDPTTFTRMMASLQGGQQMGKFIEGIVDTTPTEVKDLATSTIETFSGLAAAALEKFTGKKVPASVIAAAVAAEVPPAPIPEKPAKPNSGARSM